MHICAFSRSMLSPLSSLPHSLFLALSPLSSLSWCGARRMLGSRVMQDVTSRCETCPVIHLGKYPRRRVIQEVFFLFCGKHLPTSKFIVISSFITKPSSSSKPSPRVRWGPKIINSENLLLTPRRPYLTWQSRKRVDSIKRAQSL